MSQTPVRKDKTDARQGKSGLGVRYVLFAGLALVIVAFILVFLFSK